MAFANFSCVISVSERMYFRRNSPGVMGGARMYFSRFPLALLKADFSCAEIFVPRVGDIPFPINVGAEQIRRTEPANYGAESANVLQTAGCHQDAHGFVRCD